MPVLKLEKGKKRTDTKLPKITQITQLATPNLQGGKNNEREHNNTYN